MTSYHVITLSQLFLWSAFKKLMCKTWAVNHVIEKMTSFLAKLRHWKN